MQFSLTKAGNFTYCNHNDCEENPKYFHPRDYEFARAKVKNDVIVAIISMGSEYCAYCPDCTKKVYVEFKKVFGSHLRTFL